MNQTSLLRALASAGLASALILSIPAQATPARGPSTIAQELSFVENLGQWPAKVAFQARRGSAAAWLVPGGLVFGLELFAEVPPAEPHGSAYPARETRGGTALRLRFDGASVSPVGEGVRPSRSHFRHPGIDVHGARHFDRVRYSELWHGIDAVVRRDRDFLAYDLELAPEAELELVTMSCEGADTLSVDESGRLVMATSIGPVWQSAPMAWYALPDGTRQPVSCGFRVLGERRYGFALHEPRLPLPLVVDPGLSWSTLIGGVADDWLFGMEVGPGTGLVYLCGQTYSSNFPTTMGPGFAGNSDAFVSVLDPSAPVALVWSFVIGGPGLDWPMALDLSNPWIAVVGLADPGFPPFAASAFQPTPQGVEDGFALLIDPTGIVVSGTFLGTTGIDWAVAVGQTAPNRFAILGCTDSSTFPVAGTYNGALDHFVLDWAPLASGPAQIISGRYFGGIGNEGFYNRTRTLDMAIGSLEVDAAGQVMMCGRTQSNNFPVSSCAYQPGWAGGVFADAFLTVMDPTLTTITYSTYCGSTADDAFQGLALHPESGVVLVGFTWSRRTWPAPTPGAINYGGGGQTDAVIVWLDPSRCGAAGLRYNGVMGGALGDEMHDVEVSSSGIATFVGGSESLTGFPYTIGAFQPTPTSQFVPTVQRVKFESRGILDLYYSSRFGQPLGIATRVDLDGRGSVTFAGMTFDATYPSPTPLAGGGDTLVTQLDLLPSGMSATSVSRHGPSTPACNGPIYTGVDSSPYPGNLGLHVNVTGAPPNTLAAVLFGSPVNTQLPAPINATQLVSGVASVLVLPGTDALGFAAMPLPIPAGIPPGGTVDLQWAFLTTPACPGTGMVAASERMRL